MDTFWASVMHTSSNMLEGFFSCLQPYRELNSVMSAKTAVGGRVCPHHLCHGYVHVTIMVIWVIAISEPSLIALALLPMLPPPQRMGSTIESLALTSGAFSLLGFNTNPQLYWFVVIVIDLTNIHCKSSKPSKAFLDWPSLTAFRYFL